MATSTNRSACVVGLFDERSEADNVVNDLTAAGFDSGDIETTHHSAAGHLVDTLTSHGVPEEHANYYAEGVRRGGSLVRVSCDQDKQQRALDVLLRHGAVDINKRASYYKQQGFQGYDRDAQAHTEEEKHADRKQYAEAEGTLPVIEEQLHVGKKEVETGGVRVFYRESERQVNADVKLKEEHVDVDRHKVDRAATSEDMDALKGGSIEITEHAEKAVVGKEARVVEEVEVGKHTEEHTETVSDTVHKKDVVVEETDADGTTSAIAESGRASSPATSLPVRQRLLPSNNNPPLGARASPSCDPKPPAARATKLPGLCTSSQSSPVTWLPVRQRLRSNTVLRQSAAAWRTSLPLVRPQASRRTGNQVARLL